MYLITALRRDALTVNAPYPVCHRNAFRDAFGRDPESVASVWSARDGYPGDPVYRDFYRDIQQFVIDHFVYAVYESWLASAMEIQNQVNPQFLESAVGLDDQQAFDAAAIASMAQSPSFRDMVVDYVPTLERALDNLGRIMLSMWMQERELKEQIGDEEYSDLEDNLRIVFEGLGKLVLQMNRNAIVTTAEA